MRENKSSQKITEFIVAKIESSIANGDPRLPWHKPWKANGAPINLVSKKAYRGGNFFTLLFAGNHPSIWVTFKQAKSLGGSVKPRPADLPKNEFWGIPVYYYGNFQTQDEETQKTKNIPFLKHYFVFNVVSQCEGLEKHYEPLLEKENDNALILSGDAIYQCMPSKPDIKQSSKAAYNPREDIVLMPDIKQFDSSDFYYSTLFHELIHSTGHSTRLSRSEITDPIRFGSDPYSKEELVAELGASILRSRADIDNEKMMDNSISYVRGWLERLRNNSTLLLEAASSAQKASDFILGLNSNSETESSEREETVEI